jgi:uncharacterized protein with PQ loop repeat
VVLHTARNWTCVTNTVAAQLLNMTFLSQISYIVLTSNLKSINIWGKFMCTMCTLYCRWNTSCEPAEKCICFQLSTGTENRWEHSYYGTCFTSTSILFIVSLLVKQVNMMKPLSLYKRIYTNREVKVKLSLCLTN